MAKLKWKKIDGDLKCYINSNIYRIRKHGDVYSSNGRQRFYSGFIFQKAQECKGLRPINSQWLTTKNNTMKNAEKTDLKWHIKAMQRDGVSVGIIISRCVRLGFKKATIKKYIKALNP